MIKQKDIPFKNVSYITDTYKDWTSQVVLVSKAKYLILLKYAHQLRKLIQMRDHLMWLLHSRDKGLTLTEKEWEKQTLNEVTKHLREFEDTYNLGNKLGDVTYGLTRDRRL